MRLGDFELGEELGEGGMAKVYRARHVVLDTVHAVKVLDPKYRNVPEVRTRFVDEGRIQAKHLDHPNVVKVTGVITTADAAALVMELVEGSSLDREISKLKNRPGEVVRIMLGILEGVGHAHANGIIHRDLKPGNVLLARRGEKLFPKVTDFGIAKLNTDGPKSKETHADTRMGTLVYMSPEQHRSAKDVTPRSDVFALGIILYEMATGELPFDGESDFQLMDAVIKGRYVPPATRNPALGPNIVYAIEKALRPEPARRFESCAEMAAALKGTTQPATRTSEATDPKPPRKPAEVAAVKPASKPPDARPPSKPPEARPASKPSVTVTPPSTQSPARSSSKWLGLGLLAVALAIGGLAVVLAMNDKDRPAPRTAATSPSSGPLAVPADARRGPNGVRYKYIVEPSAGAEHPQTGNRVELKVTTFGDDGTAYPARDVTATLGTEDSPGIAELVPLLTPYAKLRGWIPLSGGSGTLVLEIQLMSLTSSP